MLGTSCFSRADQFVNIHMTAAANKPSFKLPLDFNQASRHSFCVLPWLHRFVNLGGEVQLCCTAEEHPHSYIRADSGKTINLADGLGDEQIGATRHMRDIRKSMLWGKWPAACERCRVTEESGGSSRRCSENLHFKHHIPWILEHTDARGKVPVRIRSRDYRLGNLCNLRCRMCHPRASKLMLDEWNQVSRRSHRLKGKKAIAIRQPAWFQVERFWDDFAAHIHDLEHLHFAGGEPLVTPQVQKALEICVEMGAASHIELTFNTNLTRIPRQHRKLWPQFKTVNLACSVDAFGPLNDYIRHPAKWDTIGRNLDIVDREHETLNLGWATINTTVQIYNIFQLAELLEYAQQRFSFIQAMPHLVHLSLPDYFNVQFLPETLKMQASRRLKELRHRLESDGVADGLNRIDGILAYMQNGSHSAHVMNEFKRVTAAYDRLRGESLDSLVPELAPLMQSGKAESPGHRVNRTINHGKWLASRLKKQIFH